MENWIVIDRIENGIAACEVNGQEMKMLPLSVLPEGVEPGDCLRQTQGGYHLDEAETRRRREYNAEMLRRLMERRQGQMSEKEEEGND